MGTFLKESSLFEKSLDNSEDNDVSGWGHGALYSCADKFCGQCLISGKMAKQSSSLSFPREMTGEEMDPNELEFDETDSSSLFGARLCKI